MAEQTSRFGFAASLQSRDGTLQKGALITNGYFDPQDKYLYRRPGLGSYAPLGTSTAAFWGGGMAAVTNPGTGGYPQTYLYAKRGSVLYRVVDPNLPTSTNASWYRWDGVVSGGAPALGVGPTSLDQCRTDYAPLQWSPAVRVCVFNDGTRYWMYGSGSPQGTNATSALNAITDQPFRQASGSYSGGIKATEVTAIGTFTSAQSPFEPFDFAAGTSGNVVVKGVYYASVYNGTSLTNIASSYPAVTVPGIVYLNGTYYVMTPQAVIFNSDPGLDDPTTWPGDFISAEYDRDTGVCLAKALNYVVALCQFSTQMFWDAGNLTGSPLSPVDNGVLLVGCASAGSVAQTESTVIWIAQRKAQGPASHKGRFVAILVGSSYQKISTDDVDRVLDADDLDEVYSCVIEISGHTWYVLTLGTSGITLVYDLQTKLWLTWTLLSPGTAVGLASLVQRNGIVYGTSSSAHGWSDGDPVVISGAGQAGFNGTVNLNVQGTNVFTYPINTSGTTTGTGASLQGQGYSEAAFSMVAACGIGNVQVVQDRAGNVWKVALGNQVDGTGNNPINWKMRSVEFDQGGNARKFCWAVTVLGDVLSTAATYRSPFLLRNNDNDYGTGNWTYYRRFDLSQTHCDQKRWGNYRRRAWEGRYTGTDAWRIQAVEPDLEQGDL